jgi:hypothetical protein
MVGSNRARSALVTLLEELVKVAQREEVEDEDEDEESPSVDGVGYGDRGVVGEPSPEARVQSPESRV